MLTIDDANNIRSFWTVEASEAMDVAEHLVEKQDFSYALFFGHLAVEKLLKALYVAVRREHAPPIHNLQRLARLAGIDLTERQKEALVTITAFNIETRYPDIKRAFREKCTSAYTHEQMAIVKDTVSWIKQELKRAEA